MMIITPVGNVGRQISISGISEETLITEDGEILIFEDDAQMEEE